jgi:hypothetical protein
MATSHPHLFQQSIVDESEIHQLVTNYFEGNLMIPRIAAEETLKAAADCGVHNLIDPGQPERIFFACLIKIRIINTHPLIFILFRYNNGIGEPIRVVYFFIETNV